MFTKLPMALLIAGILACAPAPAAERGYESNTNSSAVPPTSSAALPVNSEVPLAHDLHVDAADAHARKIPLLLVVTTQGCPYCARAKRQYLGPISAEAKYRAKVIVREVDAGSSAPLIDFAGNPSTHAAIARGYQVKRVPAVLAVDADGRVLADPVVGLVISDFYGAYIDGAIDQATANIRARGG